MLGDNSVTVHIKNKFKRKSNVQVSLGDFLNQALTKYQKYRVDDLLFFRIRFYRIF